MRRYDLGDPIALRQVVTDDDGDPIAATGTLTLTKPDGTTYDGVVQTGGTGVLDVTIPPDQAAQLGRYGYVWSVLTPFEDTVPGTFYVGPVDDEVPPLASFASLARKLGARPEDFDDEERDRGEFLLDEASELIRDVAGKSWLATGTNALVEVPRRVARICVAAAARAFENPEGLTQRVIGDSTKGYDRTGREGGEVVYLTDEEERAVMKAAGSSTFVAVTLVSPYSGDDILDPWAAVTAE
jgi:hypothetical protein